MKYDESWGAARPARYRAHLATPDQVVLRCRREAEAAVCVSKQVFPSAEVAARIRDEVARRKPGIADTEPSRCPSCQKWHLGHTPLAMVAERVALSD